MEKRPQPDPRPIPKKPEISDPGVKEQKEIKREQEQFDQKPSREQADQPEIPEIPEELPEKKK